MIRIINILTNIIFLESMRKNQDNELDRLFCKHDLQHCLDVARISYIFNLEDYLGINKEVIYAAALLHDIGRWKQYEEGVPHDKASAEIAIKILKQCSYNNDEIQIITEAILNHRLDKDNNGDTIVDNLSTLLYKSDKLSRNCFLCKAYEECKWSEDKKNKTIIV